MLTRHRTIILIVTGLIFVSFMAWEATKSLPMVSPFRIIEGLKIAAVYTVLLWGIAKKNFAPFYAVIVVSVLSDMILLAR